jgi:hypothetical protein
MVSFGVSVLICDIAPISDLSDYAAVHRPRGAMGTPDADRK